MFGHVRYGHKEAVTADKQDPEGHECCCDEPLFQGSGHRREADHGIRTLQVLKFLGLQQVAATLSTYMKGYVTDHMVASALL